MEETANTRALILNIKDYKESDALVLVYSKDYGRLNLLLRGAKKTESKMIGHLQPISLARLMIIKGRTFDYVGAAISERTYQSIRADINKLFYVGKMFSLFISQVKDNEKDEKLFKLLEKYLDLIELEDNFNMEAGKMYYLQFSLRLITILGYQPELRNCISCKKKLEKGKNFFDLREGGIVCNTCANTDTNHLLTISDNCVIMMRYLISNEKRVQLKVARRVVSEASKIIEKYILYNK